MKKIFIIINILLLVIIGCIKYSAKDIDLEIKPDKQIFTEEKDGSKKDS